MLLPMQRSEEALRPNLADHAPSCFQPGPRDLWTNHAVRSLP